MIFGVEYLQNRAINNLQPGNKNKTLFEQFGIISTSSFLDASRRTTTFSCNGVSRKRVVRLVYLYRFFLSKAGRRPCVHYWLS